jgi:hypothetical protein
VIFTTGALDRLFLYATPFSISCALSSQITKNVCFYNLLDKFYSHSFIEVSSLKKSGRYPPGKNWGQRVASFCSFRSLFLALVAVVPREVLPHLHVRYGKREVIP